MNKLVKLLTLTPREWGYLAAATAVLPVIFVCIKFAGFKRTSRWLNRFATKRRRPVESPKPEHIQDVARMVGVAARHSPTNARCLVQSLAIQFFLNRLGVQTRLMFGVNTSLPEFEAHAWLEYQGTPITDPANFSDGFQSVGAMRSS